MNLVWSVVFAILPQEKPAAPFGFSGIELYKVPGALGLVTGDFNGDGLNDFAVANNEKARIELFLQKSAQKWAADREKPPAYSKVNEIPDDSRFEKVLIPRESRFFALAAGDFDGDKTLELAYRGDPPTLTILKKKGEKWEKSQEFKIKDANGGSESLLAADINQDGKTDIAMLSKEGISLYLQNAQGRLDPAVIYPTGLEQAAGIAFAKTKQGQGWLLIYRTGAQNGLALRPIVGTTLGPEQVFNTGNLLKVFIPKTNEELSVIAISGVSGRLSRSVLKTQNLPEAIFQSPPSLYPIATEKGSKRRDLFFGDVNGDGLIDAAVAQSGTATIDVYLQRTDGYFEAPKRSSTFSGSANLQVGDFNGDQKSDVLVVSPEERTIGLASWNQDKLEFPVAVPGLTGKPHTAIAANLMNSKTPDLAAICEEDGNYSLQILPGFQGPAISVPLKFISENPSRLISIDIDGDGDQDLAVISPSDPFGLVINEGDGKFTAVSSEGFGGKWLLSGAISDAYQKTTLANGREALLVAKKNLARAVALGKDRKLAVLEQYAAPSDEANIIALARYDNFVAVLDDKSSSLYVLQNFNGEWKTVQEVKLPSIKVERLDFVKLRKNADPELVLWGPSGFQILQRGKTQTSLEADWSYESTTKDVGFWVMAEGDFNNDKQNDLVIHDWRNRALEFLNLPTKKGAEPTLGIRFEVFEEMQMRANLSGSSSIREITALDLTNDKKDDLLFLLHDRIVLYPQE